MRKLRFTLLHRLLLLLIFSMWMLPNYAQTDELSRVVNWPAMDGTIYSLLNEVTNESGLLFIYESTLVDNNKQVRIEAGRRSVEDMILAILADPKLSLKKIGTHILITYVGAEEKSFRKKLILTDTIRTNILISGRVIDEYTGEPIGNASVYLPSISLGTVANDEGDFLLRIPDSHSNDTLRFSHLGYHVHEVKAIALQGANQLVKLHPMNIALQEVVIRQVDPKQLIKQMIESRQQNSFGDPLLLTVFYRECVEYKHKFQQISEAVFQVLKTPYLWQSADQVRMVKGSKINNLSAKDSLQVKISAGIESCMILDIVKNIPDFLLVDKADCPYTYKADGIGYMDGRWVNVVQFVQHKNHKSPLYCGKLYFDSENNALVHAKFELHPKYVVKAANSFVTKRSRLHKLVPEAIGYSVSYKSKNNQYYVSYIRGNLRFKKKRNGLFTSSPSLYTSFEMVTCAADLALYRSFSRSERINTRSVFSDLNKGLNDDFWEDYNIIPLESQLSQIIKQVNLRVEQIEAQ